MRKTVVILLMLCLVLAGCSADEACVTPVTESFSDMSEREYGFTLRIELNGKKCVLLAEGDLKYSKADKKVEGVMEETLLGSNIGESKVEWQDGNMITDGEKTEMSWEDLNKSLIYAEPVVFDIADIKKAVQTQTINGTMYVHEIKDNTDSQKLFDLLGEALPAVCGISKVIKDETRFENIVCRYTLDESGKPVGYSITFNVIYQDTPPYVPGVEQDKDKYTVAVGVEFRADFK